MMDASISQILPYVLVALGGAGVGWWLSRRWPAARVLQGLDDQQLVRELMTSLHRLSVRMAQDVDQHQTRVDQVDQELAATRHNSPLAVSALVHRLMVANDEVQAKLSTAESKLDELTVKMESHAAEARTDVLTGMPNRRAFTEEAANRLAEARATGSPLSLVMVDIDTFKHVNDEFGHLLGDKVLRRVGATLLANSCWQYFVSRYGGEEFAVLLPGTSLADARQYAEDLRVAVEDACYRAGNTTLNMTISAGVAQLVSSSEDMTSLVHRTDQALYAAKRAGRNRVFWHDGAQSQPFASTAPIPLVSAATWPPAPLSLNDPPPETARRERESLTRQPVAESEITAPGTTSIDLDLVGNLSNRTMFCQLVHRRICEFQRGGPTFSTILLSVDNFSQLTHEHGAAGAELALGLVTQAIRDRVRTMDLVARYDDATFALVLPGATLRSAVCVGERLRKEVQSSSVMFDGHPVRFTISLGIAEVADDDEMASHVGRVRTELDRATIAGGNRTGFVAAPVAS